MTSTESVVTAVRAVAAEYGHEARVTHDIGADQVSRRTAAPMGTAVDPDGSLPHEAFLEIATAPRLELTVYPDGDAAAVVEGVEFPDLAAEEVPAFVRALYEGGAHVRGRRFPPGRWLVVPVPGGREHREPVLFPLLSPWLSSRVR